MTPEYTPEEIARTHQCQALERELGHQPSARVLYDPREHLYRRWRIFRDLTFAVPDADGNLDPDRGEKATCLIAEGATAVECMEVFFRYMHDANSHKFYQSMRDAGQPLESQPYPLSVAELNERAKRRATAQKARENAEEGMRKHMVNQLKFYGVYDIAKKYHRKHGRLRLLFGKGT